VLVCRAVRLDSDITSGHDRVVRTARIRTRSPFAPVWICSNVNILHFSVVVAEARQWSRFISRLGRARCPARCGHAARVVDLRAFLARDLSP
jgi:hypothetical protein